jgi:hypothetical protein
MENRFNELVNSGKMKPETANWELSHAITEEVSKEFGWEYWRKSHE